MYRYDNLYNEYKLYNFDIIQILMNVLTHHMRCALELTCVKIEMVTMCVFVCMAIYGMALSAMVSYVDKSHA